MHFGLDEAGRGPLAGPVVAACVSLPEETARYLRQRGLNDSKKMSEKKREELLPEIVMRASHAGIGWARSDEIDRWNIRVASLLAMFRALASTAGLPLNTLEAMRPVCFEQQEAVVQMALAEFSGHEFLFDGRDTLGNWLPSGLRQRAIVKGDSLVADISAASVVAKVVRDTWMRVLDGIEPHYGFSIHKGYPTEAHRQAVSEFGMSLFHRVSFSRKFTRQAKGRGGLVPQLQSKGG